MDRPDVADNAEDEAFRRAARQWLSENASRRQSDDEPTARGGEAEHVRIRRVKEFTASLHDAGFLGLAWPEEYGGHAQPLRIQEIFNEEAAEYDLPNSMLFIGMGMCAPTILTHGSDRQKSRYLRPLLRGEEIWCQLFSEPSAGSDVASLQTRAVRDGDTWVLNGQKVWTTGAQYCDFGIALARTDPDVPKHRGLTMFVVDMRAPGVEIKPLRQMNGSAEFNEVFFDDVRVRDDERLGDLNAGWTVAITTLMNERVSVGAGGRGGGTNVLSALPASTKRLVDLARMRGVNHDPVVRQRVMEVYVRELVQSLIALRIRATVQAGRVPGPEGSVAKLAGAQIAKLAANVGAVISGPGAGAWDENDEMLVRSSKALLSAPSSSIAGGTDEVQRNIIGERVLGLPREPQADRDVAFRDLLVSPAKTR